MNPRGTEPHKEVDKRRNNDKLWELYLIAFQQLINRHIAIPPHLYASAGDREFEDAQDLAHAAMVLAVAATHEFEALEKRTAEFDEAEANRGAAHAKENA